MDPSLPARLIRSAIENHRSDDDWQMKKDEAMLRNGWFTRESIDQSFDSWLWALQEDRLTAWLSDYHFPASASDRILGIIMAGNIPLVGLHDLLCGLTAGWKVRVKLSSDDEVLMKALIQRLIKAEPSLEQRIEISDQFKGLDAAIATGSNNSGRYFEYYFRNIPHLLRGHRNGAAVLDGSETEDTLKLLGHDVFDHFGLGCRNVTHLFIPRGFDLVRLFHAWEPFSELVNHHKYVNNYHYHRAVLLMNLDKHLDNGFVLLKEMPAVYAPVGMLGYEYYDSEAELDARLNEEKDRLQVVVGAKPGMAAWGTAQCPGLSDYADGADTLKWLLSV